MINLYNPQPEKLVCFQELFEEKEAEADSNNNGEGVARIPNCSNR